MYAFMMNGPETDGRSDGEQSIPASNQMLSRLDNLNLSVCISMKCVFQRLFYGLMEIGHNKRFQVEP
jgi:hypothetical protein